MLCVLLYCRFLSVSVEAIVWQDCLGNHPSTEVGGCSIEPLLTTRTVVASGAFVAGCPLFLENLDKSGREQSIGESPRICRQAKVCIFPAIVNAAVSTF